MKQKLMLLMSVLLMVSLVLAGCSSKKTSEKKAGDFKPIVTDPDTFPIVKDKVTLTVLIPSNSLVKDFKTNDFTKWYEKKTGVHVEWEIIPSDGAQEKLNLMLASGDLPDVIMDMPVTKSQLMVYGNKGVFQPLNNLIDKYGPETKKMLKDVPGVKDAVTAPDGKIYSLPQVNDCYHCSMSEKMWVYKPWLDKLGLKIPTTTDEFAAMLKAFKTEDPNGNGKADEIPLSGMKNSWHEDIAGFLMNPFIYSDMFVKNGKIEVPYDKPEWKEGLKYLQKLYADGLIYSGSFTQDSEQFQKLGENPGTPILGAGAAATRTTFSDISDKGRGHDYVIVPPVKGPNGNQITLYEPSPVTRPAEFIITKDCKHPDVAMRWADAMYKREITLRSVIGRPGKEWDEPKKGEAGLNGKPAAWIELKQSEGLTNHSWMQTGPSLRTREFRASHAVPKGTQEEVLWRATEKYEPYISKETQPVPDLFFNEEQSNQLATLEKTITDYVDEMKAKFITGKADVDKDWDNYVQTLESMGLKDYVKIYQDAYDAKYKK